MENVKIHIKTHMQQQGQTMEQTCQGKRFPKGEGWYLVYKEALDEDQEILATIKIFPDKAVIIRTGAIRMRQEYEVGKWTEGKYEGPFGWMWMETKADKIEANQDRFYLSYELKLNGEQMGRYEVTIRMEDI